MQRAGRAGRETAGGKCFRVYPTLTYANFVDNTEPEILRCNLAGTVLTLKAMGIENITSLDFIDKPR